MPRGIEIVPEYFRLLRNQALLTQEELAARSNCSVDLIQKAERSGTRPRIDTRYLAKILAVLDADESQIRADGVEQNIALVTLWEEAWYAQDAEKLTSYHHPDIVLELPGNEARPYRGTHRGHAEVQAVTEAFFRITDQHKPLAREITGSGNIVLLDSHISFRNVELNEMFAPRYLQRFKIHEGKIIHRIVGAVTLPKL